MELRTSNAPQEFSSAWCEQLRIHVKNLIGYGSQKELADKIGISGPELSLMMNDRPVSKRLLTKIAANTNFMSESQQEPEKAVEYDNTRQREVIPESPPASKPEKPEKPEGDQDQRADVKAVEKYLYCRKSVDNLVPELRVRMLSMLIDDLTSDLSNIDVQQLC